MLMNAAQRREKIWDVVRVASGNFLEMYDFFVYGYFAIYIGQAFFPTGNAFTSLMASLATFGVGFLARPIGALVLGGYIDRVGRRKGLILTLALMALGTLSIALTPGYATLGVAAPVIVVIGRILQGFSAGVELGGVSVYLSEIATPGNKGFYCAWQSGSQQVAVIFASLLGFTLNIFIPAAGMAAWGWRVPLLVGCMIVPLIFFLRRSLKETEDFAKRTHHPTLGQAARIIVTNWQVVVLGMLLTAMTTTMFYLITAYTPTFGQRELHLTAQDSLIVTLCVGITNFIWLPIGGAISDRVGRKPLLFVMTITALLTAYPALSWLVSTPSFLHLLAVQLWFSAVYGLYNGAMIPFLTEMMPPSVRTTGFSLAYAFATAIFGGFTPAISTYLIQAFDNKAMPGVWLSIAALLALSATVLARPYTREAAVPVGGAVA